MIRTYFQVAVRNLLKHRLFTLLNLAGLSTGLAAALLIGLWVNDERSIDHFHHNDGRIFQVMENSKVESGVMTGNGTSPLLADAIAAQVPGAEAAVPVTPENWFTRLSLTHDNRLVTATGIFAGADYFKIFSYPLIAGDAATALLKPEDVVVSRKVAEALFKSVSAAVGQTISWQLADKKLLSVVSGVFEGTPANSSISFDVVYAFGQFRQLMGINGTLGIQANGPFHTYVLMKPGASASGAAQQISSMLTAFSPEVPREMLMVPYADNYLYGIYENGKQAGGRITYVKLFSLIALFVLLIAGINFMNLSTARSAERMKEIGIRKTMGASRWSLIGQYLGESLLMAMLALVIAAGLVFLLLPEFNQITGKQLRLHAATKDILLFLCVPFCTGLLAGSYPALYLSGFKPVLVLKGKMVNKTGPLLMRKGLVAFQFGLSVLLVSAVVVVYQQLSYIRHKDPGMDKEHVLHFEAEGKIATSIGSYLDAVRDMKGVEHASAMVGSILGGPGIPINVKTNGNEQTIMFRNVNGSYDLIETLGIGLVAGRSFSRAFPTDTAGILLNEAAVKVLGLKDPVGSLVDLGGTPRKVIGVTKDFHFQSLHEIVKPLFFQFDNQVQTILIKVKGSEVHDVIDALTRFNNTYNPGYTFTCNFLDSDFQAQYIAEERVAVLSKYFAVLAVVISCLGLLGLAIYTAERRRREIGIRKVMGAGAGNIVVLLSKDFTASLTGAMVVAMPLAWWMTARWLDTFAYHVAMNVLLILLPAAAMLLLAGITFGSQALKAAQVNPVESLAAKN
ncbi:FtsX-like permease family protein [Chitinophaga sp. Cy-1792]|uniref:ABC transporter permease n=1 Tax=Chitinophaga sp. Cy-1792 TaxID=2608339 RepID=UPI0014213F11|nr:FtsX-like permease family protein [Chitinophaga sp. Cy-1792]NIG55463.1 FtsX-like permease family protein [Chitinophaga sp. Cy-1792]